MRNLTLGNKIGRLSLTFAALALVLGLTPLVVGAQETTGTDNPAALEQAPSSTDTNEASTGGQTEIYERATVESVSTGSKSTDGGGEQVEVYRVRFLSGPLKGETKDIQNSVGTNLYQIEPKVGDRVVVFMQKPADSDEWSLYLEGFDRRAAMIWLFVLFLLGLVLLSGWQGVKTAISISISIAVIGFVLIPLFLRGIHPVPTAILLMGSLTLLGTGLSIGWNKEAVITALGTMGGALAAYFVATIFVDWSHLSGINATDEDRIFFRNNPNLEPRGLLFAGIIIAAAGAAEDVAVSIASSAREVKRHNPHASFKEVFTSAMIVGKDHMSALSNTLIFAYVGGSISALLLYTQFGGSWLKFINFDVVVDEIIRALTGTIGITLTVPITAILAAWVVTQEKVMPKQRTFKNTP